MFPEPDAPVLETVLRLQGVHRAAWLAAEDRPRLEALATSEAAENRGVEEVLARERTLVLFKDRTFRLPPTPTILLLDGAGEVIGRELIGDETLPDGDPRKVVRLGKGFVLFTDRKAGPGFRFLLPPVPFPELEAVRGIADVVSASPDPPQDAYLKEKHGVPPGGEFASILIGFNVRNP